MLLVVSGSDRLPRGAVSNISLVGQKGVQNGGLCVSLGLVQIVSSSRDRDTLRKLLFLPALWPSASCIGAVSPKGSFWRNKIRFFSGETCSSQNLKTSGCDHDRDHGLVDPLDRSGRQYKKLLLYVGVTAM